MKVRLPLSEKCISLEKQVYSSWLHLTNTSFEETVMAVYGITSFGCKCGTTIDVPGSQIPRYPSELSLTCRDCGNNMIIQQCVCDGVVVINESAYKKHVVCEDCGEILRNELADTESTHDGVTGLATTGIVTESEPPSLSRHPTPHPPPGYTWYQRPDGTLKLGRIIQEPRQHVHRDIVMHSSSGPTYR